MGTSNVRTSNVNLRDVIESKEGVTLFYDRKKDCYHAGMSEGDINAFIAEQYSKKRLGAERGEEPEPLDIVIDYFVRERTRMSRHDWEGSRMREFGTDRLVNFIYVGTSLSEILGLARESLDYAEKKIVAAEMKEQTSPTKVIKTEVINYAIGTLFAHRAGFIDLYRRNGERPKFDASYKF